MDDNLRTVPSARPGNAPDVAVTYQANGFFLFRQGLDARLVKEVAAIEEKVVRPYTGPLLRHNGKVAPHDHVMGPPWDVARRQSGLLNPHRLGEGPLRAFSEATTRLLTSQSLFDCLHKLDGGDRYTLHQSIFFFVSARTDTHQDRVTLDTVPAGRSFTVWIPVDQVRPANGPLFVVPRELGVYDQALEGIGANGNAADRGAMSGAYNDALSDKVGSSEVEAVMPFLQPGDVMIFGPSTPHGSFAALDKSLWRRSFQAIYRPTAITRWGAYPTHDEPHDVATEEVEMNGNFNYLRG
ncbi:Phytanoyl-CoA dioxygenase (PhyH) [Rhodospirillales bacterium URHD0017]|nr:Phytanoyl-CoA dioxygenase (PhyH) [Rhodospirillales bacterium URHD0017]